MSLKSMTGHGRGTATAEGIRVEVELYTVNRKQLDICVSLPRALSSLSRRMDEQIQRHISRGRVTGEVNIQLSSTARERGVRVDEKLAETYLKGLRRVAKKLELKDDFSGSLLLNLPDVVRYEQPDREIDRVWPILKSALELALKRLVVMREREGRELRKDLEARLKKLIASSNRIRKEAPNVARHYRKKLMTRLKNAEIDLDFSDERLLRELAFFADRSDITEETTRFASHVKQVGVLLKSGEPVGRSLDFLAQEMFREVNTMGAKANDGTIVKEVVATKAELERIREQVQNIE